MEQFKIFVRKHRIFIFILIIIGLTITGVDELTAFLMNSNHVTHWFTWAQLVILGILLIIVVFIKERRR